MSELFFIRQKALNLDDTYCAFMPTIDCMHLFKLLSIGILAAWNFLIPVGMEISGQKEYWAGDHQIWEVAASKPETYYSCCVCQAEPFNNCIIHGILAIGVHYGMRLVASWLCDLVSTLRLALKILLVSYQQNFTWGSSSTCGWCW